jgi:hypothetical protein
LLIYIQFEITNRRVSAVQVRVFTTKNVNELEYVSRIQNGPGEKVTLSLKQTPCKHGNIAAIIVHLKYKRQNTNCLSLMRHLTCEIYFNQHTS